MFFSNIIRRPNWLELERAYKQLSEMYKDLYEEKQNAVEAKEQQITQLSEKVRHWMRKYHRLDLSRTNNTEDKSEFRSEDQEYIHELQDLVAELSHKNDQLELRLSAQKLTPSPNSSQLNQKCEVIEITQSDHQNVITEDLLINHEEKTTHTPKAKNIELQFSPKFQALLERHAKECNS